MRKLGVPSTNKNNNRSGYNNQNKGYNNGISRPKQQQAPSTNKNNNSSGYNNNQNKGYNNAIARPKQQQAPSYIWMVQLRKEYKTSDPLRRNSWCYGYVIIDKIYETKSFTNKQKALLFMGEKMVDYPLSRIIKLDGTKCPPGDEELRLEDYSGKEKKVLKQQ